MTAPTPRRARPRVPNYWTSLDFPQLLRDYPPPPEFFDTVYHIDRAQLAALQEKRFLQTVARAWEIPFFQRHWGAAGIGRNDVRSLADLARLPPYDVSALRDSQERHPPYGDFMGLSAEDGKRMPLVLQTSGGTTGLPRPMLYAPVDREVMAIMRGRCLAMNGVTPGDTIQVTYSMGLSNGGMGVREAIWRYTGCIPVMTGSGITTPTRRQIEIMQAWNVDVVLGFPAYLRHMALVARDEMGVDVRTLGIKLVGSHLGMEDRAGIEELWGCPCSDSYGTHEMGMIATDCEHRAGMHIHEDAMIVEILDPQTLRPVPDGERGTMFVTTLFRYGAPLVRYNINDVSAFVPGTCACGSTLRRLERIFGRSDNMIKLRGVNVFPEAIGALVAAERRTTGEYFCIVERVGAAGRDEMHVLVECMDDTVDRAAVKADLERRFKEALTVQIDVVPQARGELDAFTGLTKTSKIRRLDDRRKP
ncbi:MAG: AMP-binding protein [Burkholderiales bacterium]